MDELKSKYKLFPHQAEGVDFLKAKRKVILSDEMGLGKTRTAIVATLELEGSAIIVCPASLKTNWAREIRMIDDRASIKVITTADEICPRYYKGEFGSEWFIINYDIVEKKIETIESLIRQGINTLILDEAHYIKSKSKRSSAIIGGSAKDKSGKARRFEGITGKMRNIFCLTGTPFLNRPIEIFNLLKAIGHELGKNRSEFARRFCGGKLVVCIQDMVRGKRYMVDPVSVQKYYSDASRYKILFRYLDESGVSNTQELHQLIAQSIIRRKKKDILDLPEKIYDVVECELDSEWKKEYEHAWDNYVDFVKNNPEMNEAKIKNIMLTRQLVEIGKLKQVCSKSKVEKIVEDTMNAVEQYQKVIIFSQYIDTIEEISNALGKTGHVKFTGEMDDRAKQKAVDSFQQDPSVKVFIGSIKAAGVGITLTEASIVMFADLDWSPEINAQAEDRAHRMGQTGTVNVYYYIQTGTIDEDIMEILSQKKIISQALIDGQAIEQNEVSVVKDFLARMAGKLSTTDLT
jgi:SWI/SNF-related matrix-associated actin-dependent regulator 1 of chromatin subfamily A